MNTEKYEIIVDSHVHWGYSITLGTEVTTQMILSEQKEAGVTHVVILPFPSTAIMSPDINPQLLDETTRVPHFIPYFYIRENFSPIPAGYNGGKWHWMRGIQDAASNYNVLDDPDLPELVQKLEAADKPIIFEEELDFTVRFVERFPNLKLIIPHLGLLGGNPLDFLEHFKAKSNIYFDTALAQTSTIDRFVRTVGPERVIFGSDIPFGSMENELSKVLALKLNKAEMERILSLNILKLTGYKP
ncbi:MAG: amidohydrolase family protein [Deltaproteobacteria bacterium]|nr:amidohydrolase family protein [Deltaproteobacteria bacterium]